MDFEADVAEINVFVSAQHAGNAAGVCQLERWPKDNQLSAIAARLAFSETAFFTSSALELRWFSPTTEVPFCGHATLAAASVLGSSREVVFHSPAGEIAVLGSGEEYSFQYPVIPLSSVPKGDLRRLARLASRGAFWMRESEWTGNYVAVADTEEEVAAFRPLPEDFADLGTNGFILTARGRQADFVSRYFCPHHGIFEDAATGSIHCALAPHWAECLGKTQLRAHQLSLSGGTIRCSVKGQTVRIGGTIRRVRRGRVCTLGGIAKLTWAA